MAEYQYHCPHCDWHDDVRPLKGSQCPACGEPIKSVVVLTADERRDDERGGDE